MNTKFKPLTAIQAGNVWRAADFNRDTAACLLAIRDGHHVVLEKLTEQECHDRFAAWVAKNDITDSPQVAYRWWLRACIDAGLVKP